jgi:hypothetical protein
VFYDFEGFLLVVCVMVPFLFGGLFLVIRFLGAVQRVLRRVQPDHRRMEPERVWLNLIPIFNFVYATVTVVQVAESLRNEYRARGVAEPKEDFGRQLGLTLLTLLATGCLFYPAFLTYPAALCVWAIYWARINRYAHELKTGVFPGGIEAVVEIDEGW